MLLVSHDRALLDAVGTRTVAFEDGTLRNHDGRLAGVPARARGARARRRSAGAPRPAGSRSRAKRRRGRAADAARRAVQEPSSAAPRRSASSSEIEAAEAALAALEDELADPAAWADPERSAESTRAPRGGQARACGALRALRGSSPRPSGGHGLFTPRNGRATAARRSRRAMEAMQRVPREQLPASRRRSTAALGLNVPDGWWPTAREPEGVRGGGLRLGPGALAADRDACARPRAARAAARPRPARGCWTSASLRLVAPRARRASMAGSEPPTARSPRCSSTRARACAELVVYHGTNVAPRRRAARAGARRGALAAPRSSAAAARGRHARDREPRAGARRPARAARLSRSRAPSPSSSSASARREPAHVRRRRPRAHRRRLGALDVPPCRTSRCSTCTTTSAHGSRRTSGPALDPLRWTSTCRPAPGARWWDDRRRCSARRRRAGAARGPPAAPPGARSGSRTSRPRCCGQPEPPIGRSTSISISIWVRRWSRVSWWHLPIGGLAMTCVLFVCTHNAGRSRMAQAFFERLAPSDIRAESAGSEPRAEIWPEVVTAMAEVGIDVAGRKPRKLLPEMQLHADWAVTMGCGDACPYVPTHCRGLGRPRSRRARARARPPHPRRHCRARDRHGRDASRCDPRGPDCPSVAAGDDASPAGGRVRGVPLPMPRSARARTRFSTTTPMYRSAAT